jgi:tetratricopeptide (TPR) repeat protein
MFDDEEQSNEFFEGSLKEDLEKFESFLKRDTIGFFDTDRWEAMIDHYLIAAQYSKALLCVEEALTQFSYSPLFKLRKAQALSATGNLKEALNLLTEIERSDVPSMEVLLSKASVFSQLKDTKNAIKYFKGAIIEAAPEDRDEIYLDLAMEYQNNDEYQLAINVLIEAVNANKSNEGAIYELAYCYDQIGDTEKSIQCYSDFIDDNPYSFTAWYNLGNAYSKLEKHEKALWAYDYCILINDDFGPAYFNLGHTSLSLNRYTKAIEHFEKCMELDGDDPLALCYIGECHEQLNQLELARHYYKRSLELAPMLPDAWLGLGIVEDMEGNTQEGLTLILKASELDPNNPSIYHVLAGAYEKLEEHDKAIEYYEMSLNLDANDEECLLNYVDFLSTESNQVALDYLEMFEEINSGNALVNVLKVSVLWRLGHSERSIELFKSCLTIDRDKALELFEINPALKNVSEFVLLGDQ